VRERKAGQPKEGCRKNPHQDWKMDQAWKNCRYHPKRASRMERARKIGQNNNQPLNDKEPPAIKKAEKSGESQLEGAG